MQPISCPAACSRRIVIVEDDETLALLLRYNLGAAGYAVEIVTDGVAALRLLIDHPPALVLLDWNIPRLSGIEILRQLRRAREARVPVVMLTARTDPEDRKRALAIGADAYIGKPFAVRDVLTELARLLTRDIAATSGDPGDFHRHRTFTPAE